MDGQSSDVAAVLSIARATYRTEIFMQSQGSQPLGNIGAYKSRAKGHRLVPYILLDSLYHFAADCCVSETYIVNFAVSL